MYYSAGRGVVRGTASALMLLLLGGGVGAQRPAQNPLFRILNCVMAQIARYLTFRSVGAPPSSIQASSRRKP